MKNYKTTIIGAALAGLSFLAIFQSNGGDIANWQQWLIPVAIAALGYVAKDAGVTGAAKLLIASLCLLSMPACTTDAALNAKLIDSGIGLVTLGMTQKAPMPPPVSTTASK
jgi:hypothetical protein